MNTPHSDSTHTSLAQLFNQNINGMQVKAIEIPQFQRDYAQGRSSPQVQHIRERFIASLYTALDSDSGIDLDFVFGDVVEKEHDKQKIPTLYPLDGQQRLTTLFLLHCYLAWHIPETQGAQLPWHAFSYATRPGARAFCKFLTGCRPDLAHSKVSDWLKDQSNYLPTWKHDPTIQGMLVMLDAVHERYSKDPGKKQRAHWERLTNPGDPAFPAIRFHLLPIRNDSEINALYVKMNSRGKPLTDFENFKADLEALMREHPTIPEETKRHFSNKIDTDWADLFWHYRGTNHLIDEEFMRYLRFLAEVQAWKIGKRDIDQSLSDRQALSSLTEYLLIDIDWTMRALDVWLEADAHGIRRSRAISALFSQFFTRSELPASQPLRVFNFGVFDEARYGVDMLRACCDLYGTNSWRLAHTLLFYGVLCGQMTSTPQPDLAQRLRLLRNLIEASRDEIRAAWPNNMPALLAEVEGILANAPLDQIKTFNQVQVANEHAKRHFLTAHPALQEVVHQLEDHPLLRGGLTVFDWDGTTFAQRAAQLPRLFMAPYHQVTAALLAKGNPGRSWKHRPGYSLSYLGAPHKREPWENLFRARKGEQPHPVSAPLMALLDDMAAGQSLESIIDGFLNNPATVKDWRYYLVKYPQMRSGNSGNHVIGPGYAMCMLKVDSCDQRSYHCDSYLLALTGSAGLTSDQVGNDKWPWCFSGDGTETRDLILAKSGIRIRCVNAGWMLSELPADPDQRNAFNRVANQHRLHGDLCAVPQVNGIDSDDRITIGAALLRDLIAVGL